MLTLPRTRALLISGCLALTTLIARAPVPVAAAAESEFMLARVLELTNQERRNAGLVPLSVSSELTSAAQEYSVVLATSGCFAHTCGPVPNVGDRASQAGYQDWTTVGENIAAGYPGPDEVFSGWMNSPGHRANLLSPSYTEIGLGVVGMYWTQDFGARRGGPASMPMAQLTPPADDTPVEGE